MKLLKSVLAKIGVVPVLLLGAVGLFLILLAWCCFELMRYIPGGGKPRWNPNPLGKRPW